MKNKGYYISATLLLFLITPLTIFLPIIISALLVSSYLPGSAFIPSSVVLSMILAAFIWIQFAKRTRLPETISKALLPLLFVFIYIMAVWVIFFGLSGYAFRSGLINNVFLILTAPYFIVSSVQPVFGIKILLIIVSAAFTLVAAAAVVFFCRKAGKPLGMSRVFIASLAVCAGLSAVSGYQFRDRSRLYIDNDSIAGERRSAELVSDEINLAEYAPFAPGNKLKKLGAPAELSIGDSWPRLDGATAAYPVYGAAAQEIYKNLDKETVGDYVTCSKTIEGYERLMRGEADIFFGAQPSPEQVEKARSLGVEFTLTPIAREAFVFTVNSANPVNSLTPGQIRDIYTKKITNWSKVGGEDMKILPFQRPADSGSQTIMTAKVMEGRKLPEPLREEFASGMGGILNEVAQYRNYSSAIGYSFRFYATGMKQAENLKLLAVDGAEPTPENIRSGAYPFTVEIYAVTAGVRTANTEKLIGWLLSGQGQAFIEECGYVGIK